MGVGADGQTPLGNGGNGLGVSGSNNLIGGMEDGAPNRIAHSGGNLTLRGNFNSRPNATFTLEFFANQQCDPSGLGEGQVFSGSAEVITEFSPCVQAHAAGLALTISAPTIAGLGSTLNYTFTLTNSRNTPIENVTLSDELPAALSFTNCTATGSGVCGGTNNNRTISFATLPANSVVTATLTARATCDVLSLATLSNTVRVSTTAPGIAPAQATASTRVTTRYLLEPAKLLVYSGGGFVFIEVKPPLNSTCPWTASSQSDFITVRQIRNFVPGNGDVTFSVTANPNATPRTGSVLFERFAPLFFVSPNQLNFQIPASTASGTAFLTVYNVNNVPRRWMAKLPMPCGSVSSNNNGAFYAIG